MDPTERVTELLRRCGHSDAVLPPTAMFNEGWMLRLVLDWTSHHRSALQALPFDHDSQWYSDALLATRFRPRRRGDTAGEGFAHADGVVGHFRLGPGGRGDIELLADARQLLVVEAKVAGGLSAGTPRAPEFNQVARSVACITHLVSSARIDPSTLTSLGIVLLAPAARIAEGAFAAAIDKTALCAAVKQRAEGLDVAAVEWYWSCFDPIALRVSVAAESWENVLAQIAAVDPLAGERLGEFYAKCLLYNPFRRLSAKVPQDSHRGLAKIEKGESRKAIRRAWRPPTDLVEIVHRWQCRPAGLPLDDYAACVYSQHGEDGITVEVLRRIGVEHRRAVEIGCGANGGNAGILVGGLGWDALLVDGSEELAGNCAALHPSATTIAAWVDREGIGPLMAAHGFDDRLDYLGVDLDGLDYWIWDALPVRPRLVIVEFNPLFGPDAAVTVAYRPDFSRKARGEDGRIIVLKGYFGASIAGLAALGRRKGYRLVGSAPNSSNAYFVRDDVAAGLPACTPGEAWRPAKGGRGRDRLAVEIPAEGVHNYFRARGYPLVDVSS